MAKEKKKTREKHYAQIHSQIKKLEKRYQKGDLKYKYLYHKVPKLLEDQWIAKYFDLRIEGKKVILYIKPQVWEQETYLDGKSFIKTNIPAEKISATEVVRSYKNLQEIENAFREMKDFLKIRPIFHYTEDRVKAHVFICVLAYLFEKLIGLYCQKANLPHTARGGGLSLLSRVKAIECSLNDHSVTVTNNISEDAKKYIRCCGCSLR